MTRRKREILGLRNEQDFPHLVELALPPEGFRSVLLEMDAFHRERRIPVRSQAGGKNLRWIARGRLYGDQNNFGSTVMDHTDRGRSGCEPELVTGTVSISKARRRSSVSAEEAWQ